jgi:hypothetical protein
VGGRLLLVRELIEQIARIRFHADVAEPDGAQPHRPRTTSRSTRIRLEPRVGSLGLSFY